MFICVFLLLVGVNVASKHYYVEVAFSRVELIYTVIGKIFSFLIVLPLLHVNFVLITQHLRGQRTTVKPNKEIRESFPQFFFIARDIIYRKYKNIMEPGNSLKFLINDDEKLLDLKSSDNPSCSKMKTEGLDRNSNLVETMELSSSPESISSELSALLPQLKSMKIISSPPTLYQEFGKVENVIGAMGLALIQSTDSTVLLDIDTPVFIVLPSVFLNEEGPIYELLGEIDDIFGSIGKPMYAVRLTQEIRGKSSLIINSFVYLLSSHPKTNVLHIENVGDKKYSLIAQKYGIYQE
ncbi:uncharacterized protein LOC135165641 [Diachasmimorpha longicaudata]|uniref:uncharacterized protein LOC135165641 n=1 Tax=Diachasmimorpha longicaudata TaxID=58733 RepID=UPI0030B89323